uniref:Uncharacterized protein n=1 Tax=Arundo donax TaxID=35708 RepID=A0A0A9GRI9_ARUDO
MPHETLAKHLFHCMFGFLLSCCSLKIAVISTFGLCWSCF